jgi:hypothetical protein
MPITYVTALQKVYEDGISSIKNIETRLDHFKKLVNAQVPLVVYVCQEYSAEVHALCDDTSHVQVNTLELEDTWTYQACLPWIEKLPSIRNGPKDTFRFLTLMNAKAEFVAHCAQQNPFSTAQFAWIDFNVFHVLRDIPLAIKRLQILSSVTLDTPHLLLPGCWQSQSSPWDGNRICWRFCGGFALGTATAFMNLFNLYKDHMVEYFTKSGCISWEVNVWAYLETTYPDVFKPDWYSGDHNDSLLDVPVLHPPVLKLLTRPDTKAGTYTFPPLPNFEPTSSSFLMYKGQPLLNVRYVNYRLTPLGQYIIHHPQRFLETKNLLCTLSEDLSTITDFKWIKNEVELPVTDEQIQGIEDVRLWPDISGSLRFIATQRQWSPSKQNRIMIGSVGTDTYTTCHLIEPPSPTGCEKNWIPFVLDGKDVVIYQWQPFQIGLVSENQLELIINKPMPPILNGLKGSTLFQPFEDNWIGVVHSSEEGSPRKYFHYLIVLDRSTGLPLKLSQKFVFGRIGIEFCIGFCLEGGRIRFWYSQHDRDPVWLSVSLDTFEWTAI